MAAGITGLTQTAVAALFAGASESVLESKWHQPFSEPARSKIAPQLAVALIASGLAYVEAAPFTETVSESRWHQPWSEPVRRRFVPPAQQPPLAFQPGPADPYGWFAALAEPVRTRALAVAQRPAFTTDPLPRVSFSWWSWLSEPVRVRPALPTGEHQVSPFDEDIVFADRWFAWWSEPVVKARPRLAESSQQWLAFPPPFSAGAVQSEWSGPAPSLVRFQYQAQARPPWPDINVSWLPPLAEPVRVKPALRAALQRYEVSYDPQPFPFLGGGGGWWPDGRTTEDRPRPVVRRPSSVVRREVAPKVEPPTFADVIGAQRPTRLADVLGTAFAPGLDALAPPALDLYLPAASSLRAPAPHAATTSAAIDAIHDHVDALDAAEALQALDELVKGPPNFGPVD